MVRGSSADGSAKAQLYESNCYFPQFGKPGEVDTVYGSYSGQQLGSDVFGAGPIEGYPDGKIFIQGLPQNVPFLSAINPKPPFDLHTFQIQKKQAFRRDGLIGDFAHLHDSRHWDFYAIDGNRNNPRIYWSDDDGNYDSTKVTYLKIPKRKGYMIGYDNLSSGLPCSAHFTSDTVCDIILGVFYGPIDTGFVTYNLALFNGGNILFSKGDTAYCDSLSFIQGPYDDVFARRDIIIGNLREKGRDDLIGINNRGDWFYFKNNSPFSLQKFWYSMQNDTLLARWQNPLIYQNHGGISMPLFTKLNQNNPIDLICGFEEKGISGGDVLEFFYRGGKDFGSKRIFADSPDYLFHTPGWYGGFSGFYIAPGMDFVGDMTGTGNPVIRMVADLNTSANEFYYVMGNALNDRVDMSFSPEPNGIGPFATLDAYGDGKLDVLEGMPSYVTPNDLATGKQNIGLLALIHGSDKIPVNVNSVNPSTESQESSLNVYPNPASRYIFFHAPNVDLQEIRVFDLLGREALSTKRSGVLTGSKVKIELPVLLTGTYILEISDGKRLYHANISIIN